MKHRWLWQLLFCCFVASCDSNGSCGNNDGLLNTRKGEQVIGHWLEKQGMPVDSVTCPQDIKMGKDNNFRCQVELAQADGLRIEIQIVQTTDSGDIDEQHVTAVHPTVRVERALAGKLLDTKQQAVTVDCGLRARLSVPGETFRCQVKGETESYEMELTFIDEAGNWTEKRL